MDERHAWLIGSIMAIHLFLQLIEETLHDPHSTAEDRLAFTDGWFVPTMPDLNQRNPYLATYLIQSNMVGEYAG